MNDQEPLELPRGDAEQALLRQLLSLAPLMRRRVDAEADPPDDAFVDSLWRRLVSGDEFPPTMQKDDEPDK